MQDNNDLSTAAPGSQYCLQRQLSKIYHPYHTTQAAGQEANQKGVYPFKHMPDPAGWLDLEQNKKGKADTAKGDRKGPTHLVGQENTSNKGNGHLE